MQRNKTLEIFTKLSCEKMQRLQEFIASPYYNKNETLLSLFNYLQKHHPDFSEKKISDEAIMKKVRSLSSAGALHNKMTQLLHLTEDFLSLEYNRDDALKKVGTLKAYKTLQLPDHFESLAARVDGELKKETFRDFDHLWRAHRLEEELLEGFEHKIKRTADKTMAPVIDTLDRFHAVKKLRYMCDQANLKNQLGNSYADTFKQQMLDFISTADLSDPYLFAYSRIYLLFVEENAQKTNAHYRALKKFIFSANGVFPLEELRSIAAYMQIYCLQQINKGHSVFTQELFENIQFKIAKNILLENGLLSPLVYKNIVTCALKLRAFAWVEKFIHDYTGKIPEQYRQDYSGYSRAQLHYFRGEQGQAIACLRSISYGKLDIQLNFAVRKLLLQAEVESGATALIPDQLDAYKKHLQRKKADLGMYARLQKLFIYYLENLFRAPAAQRKKIMSELSAQTDFSEKEWFLKMARQGKL